MKRLFALCIVFALSLLLLAGCGGHSTVTQTKTITQTQTVAPAPSGITCDYQHNYAIQCRHSTFKGRNPLLSTKLRGVPVVYGTDTYGGAAGVASSSRTHFNISYLSGVVGKDWTRSDLNVWHANHKPTGFVWEQGAAQATLGCSQGTRDAINARNEANALGAPAYSVIHFAVDADVSGASVAPYFKCAKAILGSERTGVYGSYYVVRDLVQWGIIANRAVWQTRGWSNGMRWTHGCLYQYAVPPMTGTSIDGEGVDLDVATCADWGQFPYKSKPPVNPHHYNWMPDTRRTFHAVGLSQRTCKKGKDCHRVRARERSAMRTFDNMGCVVSNKTHHFVRHGCKVKAQHLRLLAGRIWNIAHHTKGLKHQAKHPRWNARHFRYKKHTTSLGGAYRQLHRRIVAKAPIKSW